MTPLVSFLFFLLLLSLPSSHDSFCYQRAVGVIHIGRPTPHIPCCRYARVGRSPAHCVCCALYAKPSSSSSPPSNSDQQDERKTSRHPPVTVTHSVVLFTESLPISSFLSSTFHSSTLRYFFSLKDEAVSFWAKIEHRLQTSKEIFQMRAERDLRSLTAMTDLFQRRIVKESSQRVNSLEDLEE